MNFFYKNKFSIKNLNEWTKYQVYTDIDINKSIKEFYDEVKKYKIVDIICIDETPIKSLQKRNHCYSEKGKRCVIKTQSQEVFKKYTGIFAISVNGVVGWDFMKKVNPCEIRKLSF